MEGVCRRLLLGLVVACGLSGVGVAGDVENKLGVEAGEKKPFEFRRGDAVLKLSGESVTDYRFYKNAVLLNSYIPDEYMHFRQTIDPTLNVAYGEKKYGHKAVEFEAQVRFRTLWGQLGYKGKTDSSDFKILGATVGSHSHPMSRPLLWMRSAWLQASINAIAGMESDKVHYVKIGMFPFVLGRAISLGYAYGNTPGFLGLYGRVTDYSPPGILLTGEIAKDAIWYDIYYAKFEDKSASFGDVFNSNKEKILGRRTTPWSGSAKDSDLLAMRLRLKPIDDKEMGTLDVEPYFLYNESSDQKVEMTADSKSMLSTVGLSVEYKNNNFSCGGEIAANFGHELVRAIDRNIIELKSEKYGTEPHECVREVYSHVKYVSGDVNYNDKKVLVNSNSESAIVANRKTQCGASYNDTAWVPDPATALPTGVTHFKNADDRYRCAYTNKYRGWMVVVDADYLFEDIDLKVKAAYGYASGDENPNNEEGDKSYKGFIGLNEWYDGKRVKSLYLLNTRDVKRPLTLQVSDDGSVAEAEDQYAFTDMHYVGFGVNWAPKWWKQHNFYLSPAVLFFWKDHRSPKYDAVSKKACEDVKAHRFLGTEVNLIASYDLLKDLTLLGNFALFFPGNYYSDIKGAPMKGDVFKKLEKSDQADLPSEAYRLGTDTAFFAGIALKYKF